MEEKEIDHLAVKNYLSHLLDINFLNEVHYEQYNKELFARVQLTQESYNAIKSMGNMVLASSNNWVFVFTFDDVSTDKGLMNLLFGEFQFFKQNETDNVLFNHLEQLRIKHEKENLDAIIFSKDKKDMKIKL